MNTTTKNTKSAGVLVLILVAVLSLSPFTTVGGKIAVRRPRIIRNA